jgi:2'-5' RNA ligase
MPKASRRVFVGIKITDEIADTCLRVQAGLGDLPVEFIPPDDIHLTLLPPWEMTDQSYVEDTLRQALEPVKKFTLKFRRLAYGPDIMRPRLLWVECEQAEELVVLKKSLLKTFSVIDHVPFVPHITLARFSAEIADRIKHDPVDRPFRMSMPVDSVQLFSSPHQGGSGYQVVTSVPIPSKRYD